MSSSGAPPCRRGEAPLGELLEGGENALFQVLGYLAEREHEAEVFLAVLEEAIATGDALWASRKMKRREKRTKD